MVGIISNDQKDTCPRLQVRVIVIYMTRCVGGMIWGHQESIMGHGLTASSIWPSHSGFLVEARYPLRITIASNRTTLRSASE